MAEDLQRDVRGRQVGRSIVVASCVQLDSTLQKAKSLGIKLAESYIDGLQQIGWPVADHRLLRAALFVAIR